jgi:transcriptional regulator of heat shock response
VWQLLKLSITSAPPTHAIDMIQHAAVKWPRQYYVKRPDMASRQAIFGIANEPEDDNDKLVELFRNRAELKKEFAALDKEKYRLQQLIKEQQGATARVIQRLEHLESLLVDPEWVHTVVVFYQLRSLNRRCERKLAKFAEQLKQQRENRRRELQLQAWDEKRGAQKAELAKALDKHRETLQSLEDQIRAEQHRVESMSGFSKILKGRTASDELDELAERLDAARKDEQALLAKLESIEHADRPDAPGLSIAEKRSINFMIIAYAQHLYLQFEDRSLVALVKESNEKSVGAINYGAKQDCDRLIERVVAQVESMEKASDYVDILKRRAELIAEHAVFNADDDAVPAAGTVATLFAINGNGVITKSDANLVGDNYWGIANVLSR